MANSIPIQTILAKRALPLLNNKLPMVKSVNRQYQADISDSQKKSGGIINIVKPPRYKVRYGELAQTQSTVMPAISTQLQIAGVDVSFSQLDLQLSFDNVQNGMADSVLDAATTAIAGAIEVAGANLMLNVASVVGTPGTPSNTPGVLATAGAIITSQGGMIGGKRTALLDSLQDATFAQGVANYFNPQPVVNNAYADGYLGKGYGFDIYDDPAIQSFTAGNYGGTPTYQSGSGSTIVTSGWTNGTTLNPGDVFTIAGVNGYNPQTQTSTAFLKYFVVASAVNDGAGNVTITLGETGLQLPGATFQSVSAAPAVGAAITVRSGTAGQTSRQSLLYAEDAFTFACVPMAKVPSGLGAESTTVKDDSSGLSMTMTEWYNGNTNQRMTRIDVLYTWLATYPELAVRLQS